MESVYIETSVVSYQMPVVCNPLQLMGEIEYED